MVIQTSIGDASKGKIISVYSDKDKDTAQTLEEAASQQQSSNPVTAQLLEQQQQIIKLLSSLVILQGEQMQNSSHEMDTQFLHQKQLTPIHKPISVLQNDDQFYTQQPQ